MFQDFLVDTQWTHDYGTRRVHSLRIPTLKYHSDRNFCLYNLIILWNNLNVAVRIDEFETLVSFKRAVREEVMATL